MTGHQWGTLLDVIDGAPIDPYETDEAYWRSMWHKPHAAGAGKKP